MLGAGVAWGIYSLRGKAADDPIAATAGNFMRAVPLAALLGVAFFPWAIWIAPASRAQSFRVQSPLASVM